MCKLHHTVTQPWVSICFTNCWTSPEKTITQKFKLVFRRLHKVTTKKWLPWL